MRLGEIMDRAELTFFLDKLIALSRKDLVKWECINYDTPTKIPTGETREICLIQSIQMRGEYYCGVVNLLRCLVARGYCTIMEANRIAARIAGQTGADVILSL